MEFLDPSLQSHPAAPTAVFAELRGVMTHECRDAELAATHAPYSNGIVFMAFLATAVPPATLRNPGGSGHAQHVAASFPENGSSGDHVDPQRKFCACRPFARLA